MNLCVCRTPLAVCIAASSVASEPIHYVFTFDEPMSWSDDVSPWGFKAVQKWEIASGGLDGRKVLRIAARDYEWNHSWELRTLQFNHAPGANARISFDLRGVEAPPEASFEVRTFDGHCTGTAFTELAGEPYVDFPTPLFDSAGRPVGDTWQKIELETGPLEHTVLTLAFSVRQSPRQNRRAGDQVPFVEYHLDNLKVTTEPLGRLMDPDFSFGNRNLSTRTLRASTLGADLDWCTFADQEDVETPEGVIHYTLMQFRDTSTHRGAVKHNFLFNGIDDGLGGRSTMTLNRESSTPSCAGSWGVRQTVDYAAIGVAPGQRAKIRVRMKMITFVAPNGVSRVQLGVDPAGTLITRKALWSEGCDGPCSGQGWHIATLEFEKPEDARAFTIYFRQRDGKSEEPRFPLGVIEPQSLGSLSNSSAIADWVTVEVVSNE
jgi:hypothetical protein